MVEAGEDRKSSRCDIRVNDGNSLCKVGNHRGFNVVILNPFGENLMSKYEIFDTYTVDFEDTSVRSQVSIKKN